MSPYLFILVSQVLSSALLKLNRNHICKGVAVSPRSPRVSHLFFADDSFFFMEFDASHVVFFKWLLDEYCRLAGQKINLDKSEIFASPNLSLEMKGSLFNVLGIKVVEKSGVYLGADLGFSRRKGGIFQRALERIGCRLASWKNCFLLMSLLEF